MLRCFFGVHFPSKLSHNASSLPAVDVLDILLLLIDVPSSTAPTHRRPLWLVLHLGCQNLTVLDDRAADAGCAPFCLKPHGTFTTRLLKVFPPIHCLRNTAWFNESNPLDNRTRDVFDRIVLLHPAVVFIVRPLCRCRPRSTWWSST